MNDGILSDDQQMSECAQELEDFLIERWRKDAASLLERMLEDQKDAERNLSHPDWKVRRSALSILEFHWKMVGDAGFAQKCEEIGVSDVQVDVRSSALRILGVCYENSNDVRIGSLLARIVLDEMQGSQVRRAAYISLYFLRGQRFGWKGGGLSDPPTILQIPDDVDWSFVKSFLV